MKATNREISEHFSEGNFPFCYQYFADDIEWKVVGSDVKNGKETVISFCDQMLKEMRGSALKNTNVIGENENFAIEGNCKYTNPDGKPGEVFYCDVFSFDSDKIRSITSYCIEKKL